MTESRDTLYLREVLALDPVAEAARILRLRHNYRERSTAVVAESILADEDLRTRSVRILNTARRDFWTLSEEALAHQLAIVQNAGPPETVAAATRLGRVAAERASLAQLRSTPEAHPAFVEKLSQVLLSPISEANQLREREKRWMQPSANPNYRAARSSIQSTVRVIRSRFPRLFMLEEAWLTELLEYDPDEEVEDKQAQDLLAVCYVGAFLLLLFVLYMAARKILG